VVRPAARRKTIALAKLKAAALGPELEAFYDAISVRSDHFLQSSVNDGDLAGRTTDGGHDLHELERIRSRGPFPHLVDSD
jgi:hypothetical protein